MYERHLFTTIWGHKFNPPLKSVGFLCFPNPSCAKVSVNPAGHYCVLQECLPALKRSSASNGWSSWSWPSYMWWLEWFSSTRRAGNSVSPNALSINSCLWHYYQLELSHSFFYWLLNLWGWKRSQHSENRVKWQTADTIPPLCWHCYLQRRTAIDHNLC